MIIVDTSVLIDFFRGRDTPAVERLAPLDADEGLFSIPGGSCQELLQGAKKEKEGRCLAG